MIKVEALIRPQKLEDVKAALSELGIKGMTVTEVRGSGKQKGFTQNYRGRGIHREPAAKVKIEIVVPRCAGQRHRHHDCGCGSHRRNRRRQNLPDPRCGNHPYPHRRAGRRRADVRIKPRINAKRREYAGRYQGGFVSHREQSRLFSCQQYFVKCGTKSGCASECNRIAFRIRIKVDFESRCGKDAALRR